MSNPPNPLSPSKRSKTPPIFSPQIQEPLIALRKDKSTLHDSLSALDAARRHAAAKQAELRDHVSRRTAHLCDVIRQYECVLLMEVDTRHSQNLAVIQEREDVIKVRPTAQIDPQMGHMWDFFRSESKCIEILSEKVPEWGQSDRFWDQI